MQLFTFSSHFDTDNTLLSLFKVFYDDISCGESYPMCAFLCRKEVRGAWNYEPSIAKFWQPGHRLMCRVGEIHS